MNENVFKNEKARRSFALRYSEKKFLRLINRLLAISFIITLIVWITVSLHDYAYTVRSYSFYWDIFFFDSFLKEGLYYAISTLSSFLSLYCLIIWVYSLFHLRYKSLTICSTLLVVSEIFLLVAIQYNSSIWNCISYIDSIVLFLLKLLLIILSVCYAFSGNKFYKQIEVLRKDIKFFYPPSMRKAFLSTLDNKLKIYCKYKTVDKFYSCLNDERKNMDENFTRLGLNDKSSIITTNEETSNITTSLPKKETQDIASENCIDSISNKLTPVNKGISQSTIKKNKHVRLTSSIVIGFLYAIVLTIAILGVTGIMASPLEKVYGDDVTDLNTLQILTQNVSFAMGIMYFSFIPTILYFFSFEKSFGFQKKTRNWLFWIGLILSVVMVAIFLILYYNFSLYEGFSVRNVIQAIDRTSYEHVLTIIVSHVGLLFIYLITPLQVPDTKFKKADNLLRDKGESKTADRNEFQGNLFKKFFLYTIAFLKFLGRGMIWLFKWVLKLKEKAITVYYILFVLIFTVLSYFAAFIALVFVVVIILSLISLYINGAFSMVYTPGYTNYAYEVTDDNTTYTLTYYEGNIFKDNYGNEWYTDDGGNTFYKK